MRVVSLLPSATEIVYALGVEPVGVSHECDHPPEAAALPSVVETHVDPEASSDEINEQVAQAERAGGVYDLDLATLERLDPDVVVSQGICDVCAVDRVLVREAVDELGLDCEVVTTDPHSLDDVLADIERIGAALDRPAAAADLVVDLRERVERVRALTDDVPAESRPRVAVLDWLDPVMVAGHWMPELVEWAGGEYGMAEHGAESRPREWAAVREYDPEVLVAAPCGFELDQTFENLDELTGREGFDDLPAVREERAFAMDGHHLVNRPGPRLVATLEYLAWVLHPDRFDEPPADAVRPLARTVA
ncbi:ABC transporter substrate-binding protein [Haloglomus halophilum]|uniref:ABC transporter substrate-binding protein n=1 Tax=Haloglomus halophilum TaxID=2962672 RepID=UPI0020CA0C95|nr:ABC transporter substrate-binding protein [Haloglomus halophilum]